MAQPRIISSYASLVVALLLLNFGIASADPFDLTVTIPVKQRSASVTMQDHPSDAGRWVLEVTAVSQGVTALKVTLRDITGNVVAEFSRKVPSVGLSAFINGPLEAGTYDVTVSITGKGGTSLSLRIEHCDATDAQFVGLCV